VLIRENLWTNQLRKTPQYKCVFFNKIELKMKKYILFFLAFFTLNSCGRFGNEDKSNGGGNRIVCIAKQYTEIAFALNAQENIVAVDVSSTFPEAAKSLPTVGYHRALSLEALLGMKPSLILQDNNIGPEPVVKQLKDLKIPMKNFGKYKDDLAGTDSLIREMGAYFHREHEADSLCTKLKDDFATAETQAKQYKDSVKVVIIHFGQANNVYLTMTRNSTAGKMVNWAGGVIPIDGERGMLQLSPEIITKADPDVILLTDFGYDKLGTMDKIKELPGIAGTKAAKNNRIFRIEEHDLVYLGPRTGENTVLIQKLIHQNGGK
jgi:iron complex transport system substrate-binding protein